jgi:hypothetical protein
MDLITARKETCTAVFESLAAARRRRVLGILRTHDEAVPVSDVAARLVTRESERSIVSVAPTDRRRIQVSLHHQHLPKLADAGLVELVADGDEVRIADHDALADDAVRTVRSLPVDDGLDPLFDALADARQRTLLSVLGLLHHPVSARRLARRVVAEERDRSPAAVPDDAVERALASLRHVHLPTLADADLLSWDPDVGRVSYRGHPLVRRRWLAESFDGALDGLATDDGTDARILSGRTDVVTYGQSLCERAEDELFLVFTTTGLLEEGCFVRIRDAVDRAVDVTLGSREPRVRQLVRERVPGATVWEPGRDRPELPVDGDRLRRVLFADREAVMVATLDERREDGSYAETAVAGEGVNEALVQMVRRTLGSRMDRLQDRSDAALAALD